MKYFILISAISSLIAKDVFQFSWELIYTFNKKEIAAEFCENIQKPMLKCNGQCYLAKQLRKAELQSQKENQTPVRVKIMNEIVWMKHAPVTCIISEYQFIEGQENGFKAVHKNWNYNANLGIDHPPQA